MKTIRWVEIALDYFQPFLVGDEVRKWLVNVMRPVIKYTIFCHLEKKQILSKSLLAWMEAQKNLVEMVETKVHRKIQQVSIVVKDCMLKLPEHLG